MPSKHLAQFRAAHGEVLVRAASLHFEGLGLSVFHYSHSGFLNGFQVKLCPEDR